jgi:hypothetical protein
VLQRGLNHKLNKGLARIKDKPKRIVHHTMKIHEICNIMNGKEENPSKNCKGMPLIEETEVIIDTKMATQTERKSRIPGGHV